MNGPSALAKKEDQTYRLRLTLNQNSKVANSLCCLCPFKAIKDSVKTGQPASLELN